MSPEILVWIYFCIGLVFSVGGQILLKYSAEASTETGLLSLMNGYTIGAFALYGMSAVLYLLALKGIRLSVAYPLISMTYFAVAYLAHILFGEPLGRFYFLGLIFVCIGVSMIAITQPLR